MQPPYSDMVMPSPTSSTATALQSDCRSEQSSVATLPSGCCSAAIVAPAAIASENIPRDTCFTFPHDSFLRRPSDRHPSATTPFYGIYAVPERLVVSPHFIITDNLLSCYVFCLRFKSAIASPLEKGFR